MVTTRDARRHDRWASVSSMAVFGAFSMMLWLVLAVLIPWLHKTFRYPTGLGYRLVYVPVVQLLVLSILLLEWCRRGGSCPRATLGNYANG